MRHSAASSAADDHTPSASSLTVASLRHGTPAPPQGWAALIRGNAFRPAARHVSNTAGMCVCRLGRLSGPAVGHDPAGCTTHAGCHALHPVFVLRHTEGCSAGDRQDPEAGCVCGGPHMAIATIINELQLVLNPAPPGTRPPARPPANISGSCNRPSPPPPRERTSIDNRAIVE